MTKQELIEKLRGSYTADPEGDHSDAEGWLLDYINDPQILDAWLDRKDHVGWWYA